jgi:hypothetical protein
MNEIKATGVEVTSPAPSTPIGAVAVSWWR